MNAEEIERRLINLEQKVDQIDVRLEAVEQHVTSTLDQFGNYKSRNSKELALMKRQIDSMISSIGSLVSTAEHNAAADRARNLLRRLRNNHTRISKQLQGK